MAKTMVLSDTRAWLTLGLYRVQGARAGAGTASRAPLGRLLSNTRAWLTLGLHAGGSSWGENGFGRVAMIGDGPGVCNLYAVRGAGPARGGREGAGDGGAVANWSKALSWALAPASATSTR